MTHPLVFVLAPADCLPAEPTSLDDLQTAQRKGPRSGFALKLFSLGRQSQHPDLATLPVDGDLSRIDPAQAIGQRICDATVPHFDPRAHALGVYRQQDDSGWICLDRFPLSEASNETCWFYPTHDGSFLSWEQALQLSLAPGTVAEAGAPADAEPYERQRIAVLWSLLADDASLSCVGLTYGGQRILFPHLSCRAETVATWSRFRVDSNADVTLQVEDTRTVFGNPPTEDGQTP